MATGRRDDAWRLARRRTLDLFLTSGAAAVRHAVLLTDGKQEGEAPAALDQALNGRGRRVPVRLPG
jgi:hypothetical protein